MKKQLLSQKLLIKFSFSTIVFLLAVPTFAIEISNYEKNIKNSFSIKTVAEKSTKESLEKNLRDFVSSSRPSRFVGTSGHAKAQEFIEARLKKFNSPGSSYSRIEFNPDIEKLVNFIPMIFKKK